MFQFQGAPLWICVALFVVNFAFGSHTLWAAAKQPNDFECELTDNAIRCVCPVNGMGATFDIALDDLEGIEVVSSNVVGSRHPTIWRTDSRQTGANGDSPRIARSDI